MGVNTDYCSDMNGNQKFKCNCKDGFDGERCEVSVVVSVVCSDPMGHPCCDNPCQNGGTCRSQNNGTQVSFNSIFWGILTLAPLNFGTKCSARRIFFDTKLMFGKIHSKELMIFVKQNFGADINIFPSLK